MRVLKEGKVRNEQATDRFDKAFGSEFPCRQSLLFFLGLVVLLAVLSVFLDVVIEANMLLLLLGPVGLCRVSFYLGLAGGDLVFLPGKVALDCL